MYLVLSFSSISNWLLNSAAHQNSEGDKMSAKNVTDADGSCVQECPVTVENSKEARNLSGDDFNHALDKMSRTAVAKTRTDDDQIGATGEFYLIYEINPLLGSQFDSILITLFIV